MALTVYLSLVFLVVYLIGLAIRRWIFVRDRDRLASESRDGGRVVARLDELQPGAVKKFWLICQKYRLDAILINDQGNYYAYVNRCRHISLRGGTRGVSCSKWQVGSRGAAAQRGVAGKRAEVRPRNHPFDRTFACDADVPRFGRQQAAGKRREEG